MNDLLETPAVQAGVLPVVIALGGFIGTKLAADGRAEISAIARGATLTALGTQGWRLTPLPGCCGRRREPATAPPNSACRTWW